jgi:hypothetical protein
VEEGWGGGRGGGGEGRVGEGKGGRKGLEGKGKEGKRRKRRKGRGEEFGPPNVRDRSTPLRTKPQRNFFGKEVGVPHYLASAYLKSRQSN